MGAAGLADQPPAPTLGPSPHYRTADAATRLGASQDWLYRKSGRLPFTARVSEGALRYSAKVIDRWVARRVGGRGR